MGCQFEVAGQPARRPQEPGIVAPPPDKLQPHGQAVVGGEGGMVTAGTPARVQSPLKIALPVWSSPSGAGPGAAGHRIASQRAKIASSPAVITARQSSAAM